MEYYFVNVWRRQALTSLFLTKKSARSAQRGVRGEDNERIKRFHSLTTLVPKPRLQHQL